MKLRTITLSLYFFIQVFASFGQVKDPSPNGQALNYKVDSIIVHTMDKYHIPGLSIGLVKNDSLLYAKGYGVGKLDSNIRVNENSIFHTASISKLFTATAIAQLVEKNAISLQSKLVDIVPGLMIKDERIRKITIGTLLNHTSGLPDIKNYQWINHHTSEESLARYVQGLNLKLRSEPYSEYHYSNLGYDLLGYIVEKVSGINFEQYVKENILDPSGMSYSDFRYDKIPDSLRTYPHSKSIITGKPFVRKVYPYTREHAPSSTLNASSKDLSRWMLWFLETVSPKKSNSIYHKMLEPSFDQQTHIGLGFQRYDFLGRLAVGHYGGDKGFRSFLIMFPNENIGLVLLANCDYNEDFRQEIITQIAKLMLID
ncbi:MAG: serine hydrolase domain-containing protein [Allomuricauda sp.]